MTSFGGQVATPRWNTGISETPLPPLLGSSHPSKAGDRKILRLFITVNLQHFQQAGSLHWRSGIVVCTDDCPGLSQLQTLGRFPK